MTTILTHKQNKSMKPNTQDTQIAFEYKTDRQLKENYWLFKLMNNQWLVNVGSKLTLLGLKLRLPIKGLIKHTIYKQFCGGAELVDCMPTMDLLKDYNTLTILDYGAEGKETEESFDLTMVEMLRVVEFASKMPSAPIISLKVTGLGRFGLLEKMDRNEALSEAEMLEKRNMEKRLDAICHKANALGVGVFIDAEESWIQDTIDFIAQLMMERYNKLKVTVYNTYQMYRSDRLQYLKDSIKVATEEGYLLGAKLVRGAYMDKERARAQELGYPSPIQPNKAATDKDFDTAVAICLANFPLVSICLASHNEKSCMLLADEVKKRAYLKDRPEILICQLYGMSDNLTFNFAKAGYRAAKYLPYGTIDDVIPYLIRRANENSSVSGDMSRELGLITREMKRRKLL